MSLLIATDETHLTNCSGDKKAHGVYLSLGNIHASLRAKKNSDTWILIGLLLLPSYKFVETDFGLSKTASESLHGILSQQLIHKSLHLMLKSLANHTTLYQAIGPDGLLRTMYPVLMGWISDLKDQFTLACVSSLACAVCMVTYATLDHTHTPSRPRTAQSTMSVFHSTCQKYPNASAIEFASIIKD